MTKVNELAPNPANPRKITDERLRMLDKSVREFGDLSGIVFNRKSQRLVGGHQRSKVIPPDSEIVISERYDPPTPVGTTAIGYILLDGERMSFREVDWEMPKEEAANIAANKHGGEWDFHLLSGQLLKLDELNYDMDLVGYDQAEIENIMTYLPPEVTKLPPGETDEDDIPTPPKECRVRPGDVYVLGEHRLKCGDCTNLTHVEDLMVGEKADMMWTDPPYNVALGMETPEQAKARNRRVDGLVVMNDKMTDEDFRTFLTDFYTNACMVTKPGGGMYVAHADSEGYNFRGAAVDSGWLVKQCLIWKKSSLVMGRQDYQWIHEPILYGWKEGGSHSWYSDRKQITVLEFHKPSRNPDHPTMKPVELVEYCLTNSSKQGDIVLDPFGGSGTTLIASEKLRRCARLIELDPRYCAVIIKRWMEYTGKMAFLLAEDGKRIPYNELDNTRLT